MIGYLTPADRTELDSLALSADKTAFVKALYRLALDRAGEPSQGEIDFQTGALTSGMSRAAMLAAFEASPEYLATVPAATPPATPPTPTPPVTADPAIAPPTTLASVPIWGWAAAAGAAYFLFLRKR
jgi:hypothetical protein